MNPVLNSHINDFNNPHQVTADQVGAPSDQEFSNHVNNKTNPHQVTAVQARALPITGGTLQGDLSIANGGNITIANGTGTNSLILGANHAILSSNTNQTLTVTASNQINFITNSLTQNGQPIGGGDIPIWNEFSVTGSQSSDIVIGPYPKIPTKVIIFPGKGGVYRRNAATACLAATSVLDVFQSVGSKCTGEYANISQGGDLSTGGGELGTVTGTLGNYTITFSDSDFLSSVFYTGAFNTFATCAFFD